ncbi:uncharacterized protein [Typha latifolia]|uniref:uncharacterized protein n=1 Tax=Typha latifolia TaxID=4733 RepID=UPI003C2AB95B
MDTIRCCIACILPCGALDVIRIVHANGRVEEISGTVSAGEIMQAHPKHVLRKPPSPCGDDGGNRKAVILPPTAELQKGKIYFLIPVSSTPSSKTAASARRRRKKRDGESLDCVSTDKAALLLNERYLSEILRENVSSQRDRRRGRVAVWRPHLESISENDF